MNTLRKELTLVPISLVMAILFGCGGGGGSGDSGTTNPNPPSDQKINGDLTGYLYTNEEYEGWKINLESGRAVQSPQVVFSNTGAYDTGWESINAYPNHNSTGFFLFGNRAYSQGPSSFFTEIDSSGNQIGLRGLLPAELRGAKLSNDGNYVAVMFVDKTLSRQRAQLIIYDRQLQLISSATLEEESEDNSQFFENGFDWLDDGQIIYAYSKSIYITAPYDAVGIPLFTAPGKVGEYPYPAEPRVSPDGAKIAFQYRDELDNGPNNSTIWVMNVDGSDPHQIAHVDQRDVTYQSFNQFAWSPDGRYIMATEGGTSQTVTGPNPVANPNRLYAIPSDSRDVTMDWISCENGNGIICVRTYFNSPESLTSTFEPYSSVLEWIE
ncbi:MAG: hypothetical protein ABW157_12025 [Candidatus Thiodiazotropha sp. LLP2]